MKVALEQNYRALYTVDDFDCAKALIKAMRDDGWPEPKDYAKTAVNEAIKGRGDCLEVFKATAETIKNIRISYDYYREGSGFFDVWIHVVAKTTCGYIECGAYLSDILLAGAEPFADAMWIQEYRAVY